MSKVRYRCDNPVCSLGAVGQPGYFSGGIKPEQVTILTGKPGDSLEKGKDYGDGICPNCATPGSEYTDEKAQADALKSAKDAYDEHVKAIKGGAV